MRLVSLLRRAHGVLLRITPPVPGAFDRALDKLQPHLVRLTAGRRWQREQLPESAVTNQRDHGLPAGSPRMPVRPRMLGICRHQSLLYSEHELARGVEA